MARLIEPRIARTVAKRLAGEGPGADSYLVQRLRQDLDEAVPTSEQLVAEASGIPAPPPVSWGLIDRAAWAEANITSMTTLLRPLAERVGTRMEEFPLAVRLAQRALVSVEVGVLLGYVSRRVLGQYDLLVPPEEPARRLRRLRGPAPPVLLFVAPNIVETEQRFGFIPRDFALWVALHEVTHRFQFDGVGWLRPRFLELVTSYLNSVNLDARTLARRLASAGGSLMSRSLPPEERNPVYLLASDEQRSVLNDIQALMAVVEGHGNYVMDSVGANVIPSFAHMRRVFERRREQTSRMQRAVQYVLGLEMKLRQYELGQSFCERVTAAGGPEVLSKLWVGPDSLPTLAELREPDGWLSRVA